MALKRMWVLASHEPDLDPRIDWVARFAVDLFHVTVVGTYDPARPRALSETRTGYQIERLTRSLRGIFACAWAVGGCFGASAAFWLCVLAFSFLAPFFVVCWGVNKIVRGVLSKLPLQSLATLMRHLARPVWVGRHFLTTAATLYRGLRHMSRPDLIYCNDLDTLLSGVVLKRRFGCKLVYDAHEYWAHSDPAAPWWEVKFFLWYESQLLRHVDAAFTVNHLLAEQMTAGLGRAFLSLPNCEPLTPAVQGHAAAAAKSSLEAMARGRVRFLFQGQFAPERGILELLQVWSKVAPDKAVLFLRGPDNEFKTPCIELARQLGVLDQSVFFLPPILETELVSAAAEVDVGIIPYKPVTINYRYCCPNKLSQYMQAGLAILSNNLDFVQATIERYQCGLAYRSDDPESVLAAINRLIEDEPFRRACQRQARAMAIKEYNWEVQSRLLYETCARLVEIEMPTEQLWTDRVA